MIEVAIGEYGTDVLETLFDSTTQNPSINIHHHHRINSDDEESQLENGEFKISIKIDDNNYANLFIL